MPIQLAYTTVILIWSTTPLAIFWSSEGVGMLFGVTARMMIGLIAVWLLLYLQRHTLRRDIDALKTYAVCGLGIYSGMMCVYYAAQWIPTGWISVVFGLSPIITGILAHVILGEDALTPNKIIGMVLGLLGLCIIFGSNLYGGQLVLSGLVAVFTGTMVHSLSAVTIKKIGAQLDGVSSTAGGLLLAAPMFLLTWLISDGQMPPAIAPRTLYAIFYLGIMGSAIGFVLYYYVLTHMQVSRVALITLITPVTALCLGHILNREPLTPVVLTGAVLIVSGLLLYEFGQWLNRSGAK